MISSNHKKTRWIRWIRKVSFEMMIFVIILTPKSQGFSPWWFWGSLNSRRKPHQSWIAQGIPSPGLDGTYEPCIGTSRVQRTDQLHLTTVAPVRSWWIVSSTVLLKKNQPNYGTSHPDCGSIQRWQKKILRQSLPALLCRSTAGMRNNIGKDMKRPCQKEHSGRDVCGSSQPSLNSASSEKDKWQMTYKSTFFEVTRKLTHNYPWH